MIIFIFLILLLLVSRMQISKEFHRDYLAHEHTLVINGVFVLLVLFSHSFANATNMNTILDLPYKSIQIHLDQAIVIPFLMFSGYGISLSLMNKKDYMKTILKKRLPQLLLHFDIAVIIYLLLSFALGQSYDLMHILLALIGFTSVGNSNWYIFVMLLLYVFLIFSYFLNKKQNNSFYILCYLIVFSGIYMVMMRLMNMPSYYYNTILTVSFGFGYALFKDRVDLVFKKYPWLYYLCLFSIIILYIVLSPIKNNSFVYYEIMTLMFSMLLILVMMKVKFSHPFLKYCGQNVFSIYILQRIPLHILSALKLNSNAIVLVLITFICTLLLTQVFNKLLDQIDRIIFK